MGDVHRLIQTHGVEVARLMVETKADRLALEAAAAIMAEEASRIGLVSDVVPAVDLLETSYQTAERISEFSRIGVELSKRMLWSSLDASSLRAHMDHEGNAQLYVRLTTRNFEESIAARKEGRAPKFVD